MPPTGLPALDLNALATALPGLITETSIDNQVTNIQNWLDPLIPVHAIGFSINEPANGDHTFAVNFRENQIHEIALHVAQRNHTIKNHANGAPVLFNLKNGDLTIFETTDDGGITTANGVALGLSSQNNEFGTFSLVTDEDAVAALIDDINRLRWFNALVSNVLYNTWSHHLNQEKIRFLNLYETVSSSLCYAGDLQELLTSIISIIVSEIPSEEGSILLFDDSTYQLEFFSAMGETGESFIQCCFPADKGVAGKALQDGEPVIVNDVTTCPYFFSDFDNDSGFVTKSILAAPIIVGEEKVGVIEAINKVGSDHFDESDKRMLIAIADEVGLAVKNARMFDYVVNSYCKMRQGQMSCKGCVRPLKSWTPCARQLELV